MKFLHLTDTHLAPIGTRFRRPGFEDAIFAKLEQAASIAHGHGLELVIHTGDVFDLQNPRGIPRELVRRFMDYLAGSNLEWVFLTGQHDLQGRDPSSFRRCPLALLEHHPAVRLVSGASSASLVDLGEGNTLLLLPYSHTVYDVLHQLNRIRAEERPTIVATHAMVVEAAVPWEHIVASELAGAASVVLSGDYHPGINLRLGDTFFCNPGALARVDRSEAGRRPQVAVVDTEAGVTFVSVDCDPDAFDLEAADDQQAVTTRRSEFADKLSGVGLDTARTWEDLQRHLPDEEDAHVIKAARTYYERAMDAA